MAEMRTELQMIKMSEIQSQEVAWLWKQSGWNSHPVRRTEKLSAERKGSF